MSKRKRNVDSAAPAQPKLHEFPDWPFEQVMEVVRMLYAVKPFKFKSKGAWFQWNPLIEEAFEFLDKLHEDYEELAENHRREKERREKEAAEAAKLPDPVPFEEAKLFITGRKRIKFARKNFDKFVRYNRRDFDKQSKQFLAVLRRRLSLSQLGLTFETLNRQFARWRKSGVPRDVVLHLREMFKDSWKEIIPEEDRAKARKRWSDDRRTGAVKQSIKQIPRKEKALLSKVIKLGHDLEVERVEQAKTTRKRQ